MADPIDPKVVEPTIPPAPPAKPTLSEDQISTMVDKKAEEKAETIATEKVEKLKEDLAASLSGKKSRYGEAGPESWEKLQKDTVDDAVKIAEEKIEARLEKERKANEDKVKFTQKQVEDRQKADYAQMSAEWQEAVADGILPDIGKDVKTKLKSGVKYEELTEDEQKDAGLRAYNGARLLHIQLKNEGKATSFYRTATQYRKQPAGARAPVMGGAAATPGDTGEDYSYDEIKANRKSKFNF